MGRWHWAPRISPRAIRSRRCSPSRSAGAGQASPHTQPAGPPRPARPSRPAAPAGTTSMPPPRHASVRRSECSRDYCSDRSEMSVGRGSMENMARESPPTGKHLTGDDPLDGFSPATRAWFDGAFAEPTQAQSGAWRAIGKGEDTLVVAPTGSGKALAVEIERNLRAPLTGIGHAAHRLGLDEPDIKVAVRTGDTAAEERRKLATKPPDIFITTPESLFLLLTSQAREPLRGAEP